MPAVTTSVADYDNESGANHVFSFSPLFVGIALGFVVCLIVAYVGIIGCSYLARYFKLVRRKPPAASRVDKGGRGVANALDSSDNFKHSNRNGLETVTERKTSGGEDAADTKIHEPHAPAPPAEPCMPPLPSSPRGNDHQSAAFYESEDGPSRRLGEYENVAKQTAAGNEAWLPGGRFLLCSGAAR